MMINAVAGVQDGGRIRTLAAPLPRERDTEAALEVLLSWCRANGLPTDLMLGRHHIEIHQAPNGPEGQYEILWREALPPDPDGPHRELGTVLRRSPLLVEPQGVLAGENTCGHVRTEPSPVVDGSPLFFACDQFTDPATSRHPGEHTGNRAIDPATDRPAGPDGTGYRMTWPNEHPGEMAFRYGVPYVGDMDPHIAHALILARLTAIADRRPPVTRDSTLIRIFPHVRGLREIALRHEPLDTLNAGTVCNHDYVSATGLTAWPCPDYRDALAGIVHFPTVATR